MCESPTTAKAIDESNRIEIKFLKATSNGISGLESILSLQDQIASLYKILSTLIRKKQSIDDYDQLHLVLNKWDSLYSYYNLDFGKVGIVKDKSLNPESLARNGFKKYIIGTVVKCAMQRTVTVLVERTVDHHPTGKKIPRSTKYLVHDPDGCCQIGDKVLAFESRPISKRKHHIFFRKIYQ